MSDGDDHTQAWRPSDDPDGTQAWSPGAAAGPPDDATQVVPGVTGAAPSGPGGSGPGGGVDPTPTPPAGYWESCRGNRMRSTNATPVRWSA